MSDGDLAWSWVDHLRSGGTTRWRVWAGILGPEGETLEPATPWTAPAAGRARALPGAQRLEVLRRLNLAGDVPPLLVDTVLGTTSLGRGQQERRLVAGGPEPEFGAPRVAPSQIPVGELRRVATGALADLARQAPSPAVVRAGRRPRRPTRLRLTGDPVLATAYAGQLAALGHPLTRAEHRRRRGLRRLRAGREPDVAVLLAPLDQLLADLWTQRVLDGGRVRWLPWLQRHLDARRLPEAADAAVVAARWAGRLGPERVHVVGTAAALGTLAGRPLTPPRRLSHAAVEAARATSTMLHVALPEDRTAAVLRQVVVPWLAASGEPAQGPAPSVVGWLPPEAGAWLDAQATRVHDALRVAGYPGAGDEGAEVVRPTGVGPGRLADEAVLEVLLGALPRAARSVASSGGLADQEREEGAS